MPARMAISRQNRHCTRPARMKVTTGIPMETTAVTHLERIHLVDVVDAADAEQRHDQESAAGAEVADIDAHHDHADEEPGVVALAAGERLQPSAQRKAEHEHDRGKEQKPRQQFAEPLVAGFEQQPAAEPAADA